MSGPLLLPTWEQLEAHTPVLVASMRRYLDQIACSLQPGSVGGADLSLRCFATFLTLQAPEVASVAGVTRTHIEDYKPWLAARPGQKVPRLKPPTIAGQSDILGDGLVALKGALSLRALHDVSRHGR